MSSFTRRDAEPVEPPGDTAATDTGHAGGAGGAPRWLGIAPALFLLLWSLGFPVAKIGTAYVDPMLFLVLRYSLVLVVLAPLLIWLRPAFPRRGREWLHLGVVGVLIQTVYFGLCYSAFAVGASAGTVALIVSLQPILVALGAPSLVGESIGRRHWLGLALGLAGAMIVILGRAAVEATSVAGILCAAGALLGMSAATLYEKRFGGRHHPVAANAIQYAAGLWPAPCPWRSPSALWTSPGPRRCLRRSAIW